MLLHATSNSFLYKKYNQLFDMVYAENLIVVGIAMFPLHASFLFMSRPSSDYRYVLIQPVGDGGETKSMYKEVVLGGDVWDLLDEIMIYMGNPMQYYEKGVRFVRVIVTNLIKEADFS